MRQVTSAELVRQFGQLRSLAEPIAVTHHGRTSHVLVPAAKFHDGASLADPSTTDLLRSDAFQAIIGLHDAGLIVVDDQFRILFANRTAASIMRAGLNDLPGQSLWAVAPEAENSVIGGHLKRAVRTGECVDVDSPSPSRPGTWIHMRTVGIDHATAIMFRDITEAVETTRRADVKSAMLRGMDQHGGIRFVRTSPRGHIERASRSFAEFVGLAEARLQGVALPDLIVTPQRRTFREYLDGAMQSEAVPVFETSFLGNDGTARDLRVSLTGLFGAHGNEGVVMLGA